MYDRTFWTKVLIALIVVALFISFIHITAYGHDDEPIIQSDEFPMTYINASGSTHIEITLERYYDSNCFIARITTSDPHLLRTCFAGDDRHNVGVMTDVSAEHDAVFMVNADWSFNEFSSNFVIRNGEVIKEDITEWAGGTYFCIMDDGHLDFFKSHTPVQKAVEAGVRHCFTFWDDNLFKNGEPHAGHGGIAPRTFMGEVPRDDDLLEYVIVVADGRRKESKGLTLMQEAEILYDKGCNIGYNLDGGGSSEMVFDGKILNVPSDGHERRDHDFIYVKLGD